ncbi:MAG: T9SS type A sorting domain-containing protein, partial [Saprospiraceae bacterium]
VQVNPQLQNLDGLEHLQTIAKSIAIHQNPLLQNVAGLQNLTNVGGEIEFSQNLSLSDCAIFAVCDGLLNQPEKIYIFNNASGCNSPAEVATMCHSVPVLVEVRLDGNADCLLNAADSPLAGVQVRLSSTAQMTLRPTRNDGKAFLHYLDAGAFSLSLPQFPTDHWTVCQEPLNLLPDTILQDTIHATFLLSPVDPCPEMKLDLGMPANFRGCFAKSELEVSVENVGGGVAKGVKIAVVLPAAVELISAVPALSAQSGDTLFFEAGEVQPFAFAKVKLTVHTRCENFLLGQTLCVEAFSSLENTCPVNLPERSEIKLTAECLGDTTVRFTLKNIGDAATQNPHQFKIYRNENLFKTGDFSLDIQASLIENVPADGATYRMEATKLDNGKLTFAALEKCGGLTPGWITAFWLDNNLSGYDFDCRPVLLAYDPNQKTAVPAGAGPDHLLAANRPLQYTIDFQNTGSDTAFRVLIRDVLDNSLEIETFRPGFASHPYTWEIRGNTLEVLFLPIMLPDSNMNEPASHGFFSFEIEQKPNLSDGVTLENTAGIIFDFNPPIVTNTVRHTIGQLTVQVDEPQAYVTLWEVLGNPTRDLATFRATAFIAGEKEFALYNATGQLVRQAQFFGQSFYFQRNGLSAGLYFFRIRDDAGRVFSGRIGLVD